MSRLLAGEFFVAVLAHGEERLVRCVEGDGIYLRVGLSSVGAVAGKTLQEVARGVALRVPEAGAAEVAAVRVPVDIRRLYAGRRGAHVDGVVGGTGAAVAGLAEVGSAGHLDEIVVLGLVRVVAAVAVLLSQAGVALVLGPAGVEHVGPGGGDRAIVTAEAQRLEAGELTISARLAGPEQLTLGRPRQVAGDTGRAPGCRQVVAGVGDVLRVAEDGRGAGKQQEQAGAGNGERGRGLHGPHCLSQSQALLRTLESAASHAGTASVGSGLSSPSAIAGRSQGGTRLTMTEKMKKGSIIRTPDASPPSRP